METQPSLDHPSPLHWSMENGAPQKGPPQKGPPHFAARLPPFPVVPLNGAWGGPPMKII